MARSSLVRQSRPTVWRARHPPACPVVLLWRLLWTVIRRGRRMASPRNPNDAAYPTQSRRLLRRDNRAAACRERSPRNWQHGVCKADDLHAIWQCRRSFAA